MPEDILMVATGIYWAESRDSVQHPELLTTKNCLVLKASKITEHHMAPTISLLGFPQEDENSPHRFGFLLSKLEITHS